MASETWNITLYKTRHFKGDGLLFENVKLNAHSTKIVSTFAVHPFNLFAPSNVVAFFSAGQQLSDPLPNTAEIVATGYNYAKVVITYSGTISPVTKDFYFFILYTEYAGPKSVTLHLEPDHLQNNASYLLLPSTKFRHGGRIYRRHKDRFSNYSDSDMSANLLSYQTREDRDFPLERLSSKPLEYRVIANRSSHWYLIYKSSAAIDEGYSAQNAVTCYLTSDYSYDIQNAWSGSVVTISAGVGTSRYMVRGSDSPFKITDLNGNVVTNSDCAFCIISTYGTTPGQTTNGSTDLALYDGDGNFLTTYHYFQYGSWPSVTVNYSRKVIEVSDTTTALDNLNPFDFRNGNVVYTDVGTYSGSTSLKTIDYVDRTDSKLLKVIELPAPPEDLIWDETGIYSEHFSPDYSERMLVYDNPTEDFTGCALNTYPTGYGIPSSRTFADPPDYGQSFLGNGSTIHDPRLYNSQFHLFKVVYDSYSFEIPFEDIDFAASPNEFPTIYFIPSSDINSDFLIKGDLSLVGSVDEKSDFPFLFVSSRSNEMPLFSSAYLNYLRNGYNYDQKKITETRIANWTGFGASMLATIASFIATIGSGGSLAPFAVASAGATASSLTNALINESQSKSQFDENLTKLKTQSTNVSQSNSVSLLRRYEGEGTNKNWIYWVEYGLSDNDHHEMEWLFHRYGYAVNDIIDDGTIDFHTRIYFDYIQGDIIPDDPSGIVGGQDALSSVIDSFSKGITVIHDVGGYDCDDVFKYENWEKSIIDNI